MAAALDRQPGSALRGGGGDAMATVDFYRYKARDGREIPLG
jgi:hypothetical protein